MTRRIDWTFIDSNTAPPTLWCKRCGKRWPLVLPMKVSAMVLVERAFRVEHEFCTAPKPGPAPEFVKPATQEIGLSQLQDEQAPWVRHNFPGRQDFYPLLGAVEELGELAHAHLKGLQGIRGTTAEHEAKGRDAVGDVIVFLADYCTARGWRLGEIVTETWAEVRLRDWKADPKSGKAAKEAGRPDPVKR